MQFPRTAIIVFCGPHVLVVDIESCAGMDEADVTYGEMDRNSMGPKKGTRFGRGIRCHSMGLPEMKCSCIVNYWEISEGLRSNWEVKWVKYLVKYFFFEKQNVLNMKF